MKEKLLVVWWILLLEKLPILNLQVQWKFKSLSVQTLYSNNSSTGFYSHIRGPWVETLVSSLPCKSNQTAHFLGISQIPIDHNRSTDGMEDLAWHTVPGVNHTNKLILTVWPHFSYPSKIPFPAAVWSILSRQHFWRNVIAQSYCGGKLDYQENDVFLIYSICTFTIKKDSIVRWYWKNSH